MVDAYPNKKFADFAAFWPFYVSEHYHRGNRRLHFIGTAIGLVFLAAAIMLRRPALLLGMPLFGYSFAWIGHFGLQHNRPATFKHPLWSLRGDYKMFFLMLTGRMDQEIARLRGSK